MMGHKNNVTFIGFGILDWEAVMIRGIIIIIPSDRIST